MRINVSYTIDLNDEGWTNESQVNLEMDIRKGVYNYGKISDMVFVNPDEETPANGN